MMERRRTFALAFVLLLTVPACAGLKRCAYEPAGRDDWQQPDRVVAELRLAKGESIADLGSGGGYFTFRLAEAVGTAGRVFAVDVDDGLLDYVRDRAKTEGRANVETVRAGFDDPRIPKPVDVIFTSNTYHHLSERTAYFSAAKRYLKPGGRVAIVEFKPRTGLWASVFGSHATSPEEIRAEMTAAGYTLEGEHVYLERQSYLVFRAKR